MLLVRGRVVIVIVIVRAGAHHHQKEVVFESPVLGLAKDCNRTGLRPNKTKTEKDCLLVFCSLGLGLFILEKSKRPKKTGF